MGSEMGGGFSEALAFALKWEGGFVDHPDDPGGRTNQGITQATYDAWLRAQGRATQDVEIIGDEDVRAIYCVEYWERAHCDELSHPLSVVHFDTAVNMGVRRAIRLLQGAVGATVDGGWGPQTRSAAQEAEGDAALKRYVSARLAYYRGLAERRPGLKVFLGGWLNRLRDLRDYVGVSGVAFSGGGWSSARPAGEPPTPHVPDEPALDDLDLGPFAEIATSGEGASSGALDQILTTLGSVFKDASRLEVRTFTTQDVAAAASGGRAGLRGASGAQLRALTSVDLDGDLRACVPVRPDGSINKELWEIHSALVSLAQTHRAEMIRDALGLAADLYARLKPEE